MGVTRSFLDLIFKYGHSDFFRDRNILTLGVIHPFLSASDYDCYSKIDINLSRDVNTFSHSLFIDSLHANSLKSLDVSSYQGADIIADLNSGVPSSLSSSFDLVLDVGTLEHLFDLKKSLRNIFSMLRLEGLYYSGVPCNDWVDHGFYQFSPTFFVDFARHNSESLLLVDLILTAPFENASWDILKMGPFEKSVLLKSGKKFGVISVLKKIGDSPLNFDVVQSKYISIFETPSSSRSRKNIRFLSMFKRKVLEFLVGPVLPFRLRLYLASIIDARIIRTKKYQSLI